MQSVQIFPAAIPVNTCRANQTYWAVVEPVKPKEVPITPKNVPLVYQISGLLLREVQKYQDSIKTSD